ncbi:MAG: tRNA preQ1(34) S-adenosylmethionine ribosyltransferase-isomerase QueA [Ignavibacteriales bacterium]|nr:MAG: tRNA preQ1(34) S-adenosylmethionine ribosyltransferase-isomerase QueA [Ignavibacteriaceae bacterium]MBV6443777.1 S-adenosylmethionine:tRNA ribosyltransferase-isomerase [Ignavibacteriaceae bacterium]MBW7874277.1 tRNA preQ1(34) S-adenosylmethionine ribosyltransferase-isomerase QueA [Ignavibacteria bacterium]MBZ0196610.1 tRNA preQ1(34) S-adenosylmethionine ribosyltransferase-isomerase QueA [Ignavibacteriaceae bacterium]MCZ2142679.1 tRNA preQ1(34) S-adenosylmethionine ribosyltransferase-iso
MKLSDFTYNIPKSLVAKYPYEKRDEARLMLLNREAKTVDHHKFRDIVDIMNKGDILVLNESRVFQARLIGNKEKTQAKIEVFLLRELNAKEAIWDVIVDPARKVRIGNKIYFSDTLWCEVIDNTTSRGRTVKFNQVGNIYRAVDDIGLTPLPPYIKRNAEPQDKEYYQTVYARVDGSVAAPTAGLHFTPEMLEALKKKGVIIVPIVLHIGLGTFRLVEVEDLTKHRMDSEFFEITSTAAETINKAIAAGGKVTAVGTSTVRALESSVTSEGFVRAQKGWTDKFIYPTYNFRVVKQLITNFHMPHSTLLMLVGAFGDTELVMKAYKTAVKEEYKFLSYGDAMMII